MAAKAQERWKCGDCGHICTTEELLEAPNPFDTHSDEVICGCPHCKTPENMAQVCDVPGCTEESTCGTPTEDGYRRTCGKHYRQLIAEMKEKNDGPQS